jgi:iron complex outermembrane receptor protein
VEVNAYSTPLPLETATNSIGVIGQGQLQQQPNNTSFVSVLNQVPGVRMEERSPGSYRLSIRGSLLRSPFGVRNVKIYLMGELPFTDASGNTYLNLLDYSSIRTMEIIKGPDASTFGANSGGVLVLYPNRYNRDTALTFHLQGGSFGLAKQDVGFKKVWKKYSLQVNQAYQRSDGYRRNSQLQRHFVQAVQQWQYTLKTHLSFYHLFSKLQYETPGGLTLAQMEHDPTAARAPTATLPSAAQQQAGIYNTTTYHGLVHEWNIRPGLRHVVSAWGSYTDFQNPFVTNYEVRQEHTLGARTFIEWNGPKDKQWFSWINGYEYLYTFTNFRNFDNNGGERGDQQVADNLKAQQQFFFTRFHKTFFGRLRMDASLSFNLFDYSYQNQYPVVATEYQQISFKPQWMPRFGASFKVLERLYARGSVSRGYSPPTLAEVRPSTNIISTGLQAESGWNYEAGLSYVYRPHYHVDYIFRPTFYYFRLNDAIVRREDVNGAEFFVNAGGTNQKGFDMEFAIDLRPRGYARKWLRQFKWLTTYSYQHFRFDDYQLGNDDYSGNWLTGVPRHTVIATSTLRFQKGFNLDITYQYTSTIPLNDANEVYAKQYHVLQARMGYTLPLKKREINFYLSGDNLLNQRYSLGNDINAFGGRYYNPAPTINFTGGIRLSI